MNELDELRRTMAIPIEQAEAFSSAVLSLHRRYRARRRFKRDVVVMLAIAAVLMAISFVFANALSEARGNAAIVPVGATLFLASLATLSVLPNKRRYRAR